MLFELFKTDPTLFAMLAPILLLSLSLHEYAHARIALAYNDPTALRAGRVTLNPIKHLDLFGTLMLFFAGFGWAKPVPVNPYLLKPPKIGNIMVSLGGPMTNFLLAVLCCGAIKLLILTGSSLQPTLLGRLHFALYYGIIINILLGVFNMLPIYPLDGHHIVRELLPRYHQEPFMRFQLKYGYMILIAIMILPRFGMIPDIINPIVEYVEKALLSLTGISAT